MKSKKMVSMILATLTVAGSAMHVQAITADIVQENLLYEINRATLAEETLDNKINEKADAVDVYTKSDVYTKNEVNTELAQKADADNVYTKSDVYTKIEVNDELAKKANAADVYTQQQVDDKLNEKADASDVKTLKNTADKQKWQIDTLEKKTGVNTALTNGAGNLSAGVNENTRLIGAEEKAREAADEQLQKNIDNETAARVAADNVLDNRISHVETDANKGIAKASALAALHPLDYDPNNKFDVAAAGGFYKGEKAFALGAFYRPNRNVMLSLASTVSGDDNAYNVGVTFKIGKAGKRAESGVSTAELYAMIGAMQEKMDQQQKRIEELEANQAK